jgi:hypothetical protein
MNKDLAGISAIWRALFGVRGRRFLLLVVHLSSTCRLLVKEPPKMVLRRMMDPSLKTGTVLDAVLSVNYCKRCACVSVMAVQEKCDERVWRKEKFQG